MLRVILNRLKTKAEELLAEEQAGFRPGWSTVGQIFNSRVITEKQLQHQHDLFNKYMACRPLAGIQKLQLRELFQAIQAVYEKSSNEVLFNSQLGEFFKTTVGVRQGC